MYIKIIQSLVTWTTAIVFGCLSDWLVYEKRANITVTRKLFIACGKDHLIFVPR